MLVGTYRKVLFYRRWWRRLLILLLSRFGPVLLWGGQVVSLVRVVSWVRAVRLVSLARSGWFKNS